MPTPPQHLRVKDGEETELLKAFDRLPPRLRPVLSELAQGKSNRSIAQTLKLSEASVRTYVSQILAHFQCSSRSEIAVRLWRSGLASDMKNMETEDL